MEVYRGNLGLVYHAFLEPTPKAYTGKVLVRV